MTTFAWLSGDEGHKPLPHIWTRNQLAVMEGGSLCCSFPQVRKVHFDTQDYGPQNITGLEPKEVPLLHQQQGKGSLEWENARHVSGQFKGGWASPSGGPGIQK